MAQANLQGTSWRPPLMTRPLTSGSPGPDADPPIQFVDVNGLLNHAAFPLDLAQYAVITLANADLLALHGTGKTLVAAQGAGTLIIVDEIIIDYVYGTTQFTGGGAIGGYLGGVAASGVLVTGTAAATFLTSPTANELAVCIGASAVGASSAMLNKALVLSAASAEFAAGDGTATVKVRYHVVSGLS